MANAGLLFLRFLGAHILSLIAGLALSLLTLPLWTALLYRLSGRETVAQATWQWYILTLAPFYVVITTLIVLVIYPMWTGASEKMKRWRRVLVVTLWVHIFILLGVNLILGGRALP
jgi:hypothetical protein